MLNKKNGKEKEKMECSKCKKNYLEHYYTDKDNIEILCEDCLLRLKEVEINIITEYYIDNEYMGNDENYEELLDNISEKLGYREV